MKAIARKNYFMESQLTLVICPQPLRWQLK